MRIALYDPDVGYYRGGARRTGRGGDYITSVTVSAVFGRLLAGQFRECWEALGRPGEFLLIEQGAEDGLLLADVLDACGEMDGGFRSCLRPAVIEPDPGMRDRQAAVLERFPDVVWFPDVAALPESAAGAHFSNELVDALPVHWVESREGGWRELFVDWDESAGRFVLRAGAPSPRVAGHPLFRRLPECPAGFRVELGLAAVDWMDALSARLARGLILLVDYGLTWAGRFHPGRADGTLRTYSGHRMGTDPLEAPGDRDLTAHADFTSLARSALGHGWQLAGFCDQHHFLIGAAGNRLLDWERDGDIEAIRAFRSLIHPATMGTSFQVLGFQKGWTENGGGLTGFRHGRLADRLALLDEAAGGAATI